MYKYIILDSEAGQWIKLEEINGVKTYSHTFDQDEATVITDEYGKYLNDQPWELYSEHGMDWYNNQFSYKMDKSSSLSFPINNNIP